MYLGGSGSSHGSALLRPFAGFDGVTLVAGSTWRVDEERLIPRSPAMRLILVPHEPTPPPARRRAAGDAARRYVEAGLGAAERGAAIIERLLEC